MTLQLLLDGRCIHKASFTVSRNLRATIPRQSYDKKLHFWFRPKRPIAWKGYRDDVPVTQAKQNIECDIWLAGADPDAIIFGVMFDRGDALVMNTLHFASPDSEQRTEIEHGLVIVTSPGK